MSQTVRKRGGKKISATASSANLDDEFDEVVAWKKNEIKGESQSNYYIAMAIVTLMAIYTRFSSIGNPDQVVFDEVHFGKFASYYLEGSYFFDLHPPFAKLLIALVGYLVGYDGAFKFDAIGDIYSINNAPYVAYRSLLALQGVITVPIMFLTMKTLGFSVAACFLSSIFVCFDNAHVIQSRLILLDATLVLCVALTYFSYAKFSTYRRQPFSMKWWAWLSATGVSLSCVISTKYVGILTYVAIGIAVIHELWYLLDYRRGLSMTELSKHFFARLWCLIIFPFMMYLFWFYLHFSILTNSGPGDTFMSSEFQETLLDSPMAKFAKNVNYYDILTIKHKDTDAFLHSHKFDYPLRYEDGRVSSNTQQVTCVFDADDKENDDVNNHWQIVPSSNLGEGIHSVYTNDIVRLKHIGTGGYLLTHDVASPLKYSNEEFTIVYNETAEARFNETLFKLRPADAGSQNKRNIIRTKASVFKVMHVDTMVAMWTHDDELLPEWGFKQQEVSGNKKIQDKDNSWSFDTIINLSEHDVRSKYVERKVKKLPFLKKWWELQSLMFYHNNILTSEHPFASQPDSWPLAISGVSYWNDNDLRRQIFFTGNIVGFWVEVFFLAIYVGVVFAELVTRRRNLLILNERASSRLYNTLGFLFIGWCAHYFPFFLMNRQKFLHHYLPAHIIAALFSGGLAEFLCTNNRNLDVSARRLDKKKILSLVLLTTCSITWFFYYFRNITYGDIALSVEEVKKRQWFDIKLHYSK